MLGGTADELLQPPVNVLRLSLHPEGLAPRIVNLAEWRAHLFLRLRRQIDITADPVLADLLAELLKYPAPGNLPDLPGACIGTRPPAKVAPFAGGNEATVRKRAVGRFFPFTSGSNAHETPVQAEVAVPFRLATDAGVLSFISTTTVFGTPVDILLSELALESFFPADAATAAVLHSLAEVRATTGGHSG